MSVSSGLACRVSRLTEEEKRKRLEEMEQDGLMNEEKRRRRVDTGVKQEKAQEAEDQALSALGKAGRPEDRPEFLQKLSSKVYMGEAMSLEERMAQNRHTRQRTLEQESSFLAR